MQTQREQMPVSKITADQILAFIVFATCCAISFFGEPSVAEVALTVNP